VPIISDEIYADMVWGGEKFIPLAKVFFFLFLSSSVNPHFPSPLQLSTNVPILTTGGLAKRWMVPGWRLGWILVHDRNGVFAKGVRDGLMKLTQLILGSNSLVQSCLPAIFEHTPKEYYEGVLRDLEKHAMFTCEKINQIPGLKAVVPRGAMYVMVGIEIEKFRDIKSDTDFCEMLVGEKSVFCLPGKVCANRSPL